MLRRIQRSVRLQTYHRFPRWPIFSCFYRRSQKSLFNFGWWFSRFYPFLTHLAIRRFSVYKIRTCRRKLHTDILNPTGSEIFAMVGWNPQIPNFWNWRISSVLLNIQEVKNASMSMKFWRRILSENANNHYEALRLVIQLKRIPEGRKRRATTS